MCIHQVRKPYMPSEGSEERVRIDRGLGPNIVARTTQLRSALILEGRFTVGLNRMIGHGWKRTAGASLTIALLTAVAVVGITLFGSEVFAAWKTQSNAETALASGSAFEGLLNFDAPAATVAQFDTKAEQSSNGQTGKNAMVAKNWKFTQNPIQDILSLYTEGIQLQYIAAFLQNFAPNSPLTAFVTTFEKAWLQTVDGFLTSVLHLPPIPSVSPSF